MLKKVHSEGAPDRFSKVNEGKIVVEKIPNAFRNIPVRMGLDFSELQDGDSRVRKNRDMFNSNWNKIAKYICETQNLPDVLREN